MIKQESMSRLYLPRFFRPLFSLLSVAALLSCTPYGADVEVELEAGKNLNIKVKNRSDDVLIVDDRLLGLINDSVIKVEVAHPNGTIIPFCNYIDYVASGKRVSLVPHGESVISIPLTAITATHCLPANKQYLFRAVRVSEGEVVSRSSWVAFQAKSLFEG